MLAEHEGTTRAKQKKITHRLSDPLNHGDSELFPIVANNPKKPASTTDGYGDGIVSSLQADGYGDGLIHTFIANMHASNIILV
jgi:hypothetical protein